MTTTEKVLNFINGEFVEPQSQKWMDNFSPATGKKIGVLPLSNEQDVNAAVIAAQNASNSWKSLSRAERVNWLTRIADALDAKSDQIAQLESLDTGKPITLAKMVDAARSISNFRFFADLMKEDIKETYEMADAHNYVVFKPIGVVGLITPWNLPLYLLSWKVAPALVSGNTLVCKPSELTPLTASFLASVLAEIGFPRGVFNIVHGTGQDVGTPLVSHKEVKAISFTGGTVTGAKVASIAAPLFKKLSLELGGKNATIVFADCDLEKTIAGTVRASFANQGQICLCGSRLFVEDKIYDEFIKKFVESVKSLKICNPSEKECQFGALISSVHKQKVMGYIELAKQEGGTILCGGTEPTHLSDEFSSGYWVLPTVVADLSPQSRCSNEEIFGPVITVHRFNSEQEVIELANSTNYGLAGSVWTNDIEKGKRVSEGIDSGMIWINCWLHRDLRVPFGGVKNSGVGREGGHRSIEFFTEQQNICVKQNP